MAGTLAASRVGSVGGSVASHRVSSSSRSSEALSVCPRGRISFFGSSVRGGNLPLASGTGRHGQGGALSSEANVFTRAKRVLQSQYNVMTSAMEDPARALDQSVYELRRDQQRLQEALQDLRGSVRELGDRWRLWQARAGQWRERARRALQSGQEDLARDALKQQRKYEEMAKALEVQGKQLAKTGEKLASSSALLSEKIEEASSKKELLKTRAKAASASKKVQELLGSLQTGGALAKFEEVKEKVNALEAEAEALTDLASDSLEAQFAKIEGATSGPSIDRDFARLKSEVETSDGPKAITRERQDGVPDWLRSSDTFLQDSAKLAPLTQAKEPEVIDADDLFRDDFTTPRGRTSWPEIAPRGSTWGQEDWQKALSTVPWGNVVRVALQLAWGMLMLGGGMPGGVVVLGGGPRGGMMMRRRVMRRRQGAPLLFGPMGPMGGPMMGPMGPMAPMGMGPMGPRGHYRRFPF